MQFDVPNFPPVLMVAAPAFVILMALEWILVLKLKVGGNYDTKDAITSMAMGFGQLFSDILMGFISLAVMMWFWEHRIFNWGFSLGAFAACLLCLLYTSPSPRDATLSRMPSSA